MSALATCARCRHTRGEHRGKLGDCIVVLRARGSEYACRCKAFVEMSTPAPRVRVKPTMTAVLEFEQVWESKRQAGKEQAIRETFGVSAARFYQLLNQYLDDPAAVEHAPMVVNRLRRQRDARREIRARRIRPL